MGQQAVIYLSAEQMADLHDELASGWGRCEWLGEEWDGESDIKLKSVPHVVFRKSGTIE